MRKIFFVMGVFFWVVSPAAFAYDDHDFQVWNTDTQDVKISKTSKITLEEEFRWGDNASDFYYHHYDLGFVGELNKVFSLGFGYRQVFEKKGDKFKEENMPYGTATLVWDLRGFKFEDRSRLEYRSFDYQDDNWRYRNKITMKFPWKLTRFEVQPYVGDEVLISLDGINLNQNRFSAGLGFKITKNTKAELYYMLLSVKSSGTCIWKDANVLGTKFKISF